jgi:hypothetical protein
MVRRGQGGPAGAGLCEGSRGRLVAPLDALVEPGWLWGVLWPFEGAGKCRI